MLPIAAACCGLVFLHACAPHYLFTQGFPLDDAWIHAVYAREIARSGMLAYNPGIPATGETAPFWAVLLGPVHFASDARAVALTKLCGFALHAASMAVLVAALRQVHGARCALITAAASLAAFHPDLVAASVSGMEVPLATLASAFGIFAAVRGRPALLAVAGFAASGARPETVIIVAAFAFLYSAREGMLRALFCGSAAVAGGAAGLLLIGIRNARVAGLLLPATFYVKANRGSLFDGRLQLFGFIDLLGRIPLLDHLIPLAALTTMAVLFVLPLGRLTRADACGGALFLSGMLFCATLFALVPPIDPAAFYHQRYILPALLPMIPSMPLLVFSLVTRLRERFAFGGAMVLTGAGLVGLALATPARAARLSNDARNVDDVQVAFGRALASVPTSTVLWAVDAGASRYFGRAFVVDTIGLNSPEMLTPSAQTFLDAHPPRYLDLFPGWSQIAAGRPLAGRRFETTTPYTVTSAASMRQHILVDCEPPGLEGHFSVRGSVWKFRCSF